MPIQMKWLIDKRVIYSQSTGVITADDLETMMHDAEAMIKQGDEMTFVHLITDGTYTEETTVSVSDLQRIFRDVEPMDKRGWTLVITPSPFVRFLSSMVTQFSNVRSRHFGTIEDALHFLAESDDALPDAETLLERYRALEKTLPTTDTE